MKSYISKGLFPDGSWFVFRPVNETGDLLEIHVKIVNGKIDTEQWVLTDAERKALMRSYEQSKNDENERYYHVVEVATQGRDRKSRKTKK